MKVRFLGTATSQGIPVIGCDCMVCTSTNGKDKRLRSSCLVEINDKRIVIDIGPDFRQQMLSAGGKEIHAIVVTHEHNDHVAGLDDVRPFNFRYEKDMPVYALPRVANHIQSRFDYIFEQHPYPGAPQVQLIPIDGNSTVQIQGIEVHPIHVMHGKLPILGYRIQNFAYLTDLKTLPKSEFSKLENLDILVMSSLRDEFHPAHQTLEEAIALAKEINAKQTYFMHFSHRLGTHEQIEARLPKGFFASYDGLELEIL